MAGVPSLTVNRPARAPQPRGPWGQLPYGGVKLQTPSPGGPRRTGTSIQPPQLVNVGPRSFAPNPALHSPPGPMVPFPGGGYGFAGGYNAAFAPRGAFVPGSAGGVPGAPSFGPQAYLPPQGPGSGQFQYNLAFGMPQGSWSYLAPPSGGYVFPVMPLPGYFSPALGMMPSANTMPLFWGGALPTTQVGPSA